MVEISFLEFHEQRYPPGLYCLYVMKNGTGDVLYVGISTTNVWERWFAWGGHMIWDGNIVYGESPIGEKIENHLPDSLKWKIQLWSLEDCQIFCRVELPNDTSGITIQIIEPIMIQKLSPALNVTYNINPGKDNTPLSDKEISQKKKLDQLYNDIFNKD